MFSAVEIWLLVGLVWYLLGILGFAYIFYCRWKEGENIELGDIAMVIFVSVTGVLVWIAMFIDKYDKQIVFYGRK